MKRSRLLIVALALSLIFPWLRLALAAEQPAPKADLPAQKYELRYKFKPGEVVKTNVLHQAAIRTTIEGTSQTAATVSTSMKVWKIDDVDSDGQATFTHSVEFVKMRNAVTGREDVHYDSRTDKTPPQGFEDVAKRVGVPLTVVTIDRRGNIVKRKEKAAPGPGQGSQLTLPLPEKAVTVGESWTFPNDVRIRLRNGEMKNIQARQRYTLESVEGDVAKIKVETQVLTPVHDPEIEAQLIENETNGTIRFDIAAGRLATQQIDLDRNIVGYPNAKSSMHYRTRFTEELLREEPRTAEKDNVLRPKK